MTRRALSCLKTCARVAIVSMCLVPGFAAAQSGPACRLQRLSTYNLGFDAGGRMTVPVAVNDQQMNLLVDTGTVASVLADSAVTAARLVRFQSRAGGIMQYGGATSNQMVLVESSALAGIRGRYYLFYVLPDGAMAPDISGMLGADVLSQFDVELDFARSQMSLYAQTHCLDSDVYWTHQPHDAFGFEMDANRHIRVPVQLDGALTLAGFDTGAALTVASFEDVTQALHIAPDDPALKPVRSPDGTLIGYRYPFKTMAFGRVAIANPDVLLIPNADSHMPPGGREIIVGIDILRRLHLFIAYGDRAIYATPATAQ